jgi:AhpD family alkylhydroperoxidase
VKKRFDFAEVSPDNYRTMKAFSREIGKAGVEPRLKELLKVRASQINGCAYCIDMHTRLAREHGETEQRLYALSAWKESPLFNDKERASLALADELTLIHRHGVSDEVYAGLSKYYSDKEISDLIMTVVLINAWNRIMVTTREEYKQE